VKNLGGEIINEQGLTEEEFLEQYDPEEYVHNNPSVSVDMLLFTLIDEEMLNPRKVPSKHMHILMIKRGDHPFMGRWALPGGFVTRNEDPEDAAMRELQEETNIDNVYMEQLYTWGKPGRDPRTHVISISHMALVDSTKLNIKAGSDAQDVRWFRVELKTFKEEKDIYKAGYILQRWFRLTLTSHDEELYAVIKFTKTVQDGVPKIERELVESHGIAFDHSLLITYGITRLRNKIWYTPVVFSLMPKYFTIMQLQKAYEAVLDTELVDENFRKKVEKTSKMVIKTNKKIKAGAYRPARAYMLNPEWDGEVV
jgi:8-oxo-dGTP diphosphatase